MYHRGIPTAAGERRVENALESTFASPEMAKGCVQMVLWAMKLTADWTRDKE